LLLLISPLTFVAQWLGIALEFFVKMLNEGVFLVERLPFSLLTDIHITTLQCWLLLGFMLAASLLLQFRKFYWLWMMLICVSLFSIQSFFHFYRDVKPAQFVVYRVQGHEAMEWMETGTSIFYADSALSTDTERMRFHIRPNRLVSGIQEVRYSNAFVKSFDGWTLHHWKGKSFVLLNSPSAKLPDGIYVDYLVIGNNSIRKIDALRKKIACKLLILDSSNSWYYNQRIEKEAVRLGITCYNVLAKGAYQLKL
ncbi:MAG: hypothetical protein K2U26_20100, partial [Cyclobacteriaceae bacterium]|nr:hypothetical protein [Cyclobacteriaceae bacterium]